MKKLLLLTLAIVTLTSLVYSQSSPTKKNDWQMKGLKGKVKSFTESEYLAEDRFGKIQKTLYNKYTDKFNNKGNIIEYIRYKADGKLAGKEIYKYDDKGNKIEDIRYNADGKLDFKTTNKYDDKGNQIEMNAYTADSISSIKETYKYDDKGNIIEKNLRNNTKTRKNTFKYRDKKQTYKYDDKGNKIEENTYNADGSLFFVPVFQEIVKNHESLSSKIIIKYDDQGNRNEENIYIVTKGDSINGQVVGGGVSNYTITYKYDDKGNVIEENEYNADGTLNFKETYKYDDKGNKIEENNYNADGTLNFKDTYKYEFDEKGNWIKKIRFENQIPDDIKERKYEYYE